MQREVPLEANPFGHEGHPRGDRTGVDGRAMHVATQLARGSYGPKCGMERRRQRRYDSPQR